MEEMEIPRLPVSHLDCGHRYRKPTTTDTAGTHKTEKCVQEQENARKNQDENLQLRVVEYKRHKRKDSGQNT